MSLFRLDASIRTEGSSSRALADLVENQWCETAPGTQVTHRHIGTSPFASDAWANAVTGSGTPEAERTDAQRNAVATAAGLVDELDRSDAFLFAVPLYNFGVSQHFKTYVDLIQTDPRMSAEVPAATAGKPGVLVTVQGGNYSAGTPREGWDHATSWMERILRDVWQIDLSTVTRQFTLVGVNPALDAFTAMGDEIKVTAESQAREIARNLASRRSAA